MRKIFVQAMLGVLAALLVFGASSRAEAQFYNDAYFEAECPDTATGSYRTRQTAIAGFSGTGYLRSAGNTTANTFNNTSADRAVYTFKARRRGGFTPWFRINTNNSASDDSFFYRIDGGDWVTMNNIPGGSGWRWVSGQGMFIGASGNHTLEIANREDGLNIDKLAMVSDGAGAPSGLGGAAFNCPTAMYFETECRSSAKEQYVWDKTAKSGYSGSGYLEAITTSTDANVSTDEVVYPFESGAGSYNLYFRIHNNSSGTSDSWFYQLDDGPWVTMNNTSGLGSGWRWARSATSVTLSRGDHLLRIRNREAGLSLDKIGFIPTSASAPTGTSLGAAAVNCEPFHNMADWGYFEVLEFYTTHTNYMGESGEHMLPHHYDWHRRNGSGGTAGAGSGTAFLGFHRAMMNEFRKFALENGGRSWLPMSASGEAIPPWLPDALTALDLSNLIDWYIPRDNESVVGWGIPSYLTVNAAASPWHTTAVVIDGNVYSRLGDIPDLDTLGRAIAARNYNTSQGIHNLDHDGDGVGDGGPSYHAAFHDKVGGTMSGFYSPTDPIFYGWHGLLEKIVDAWLATANGRAWAAANPSHPFLVIGFTDHHDWENEYFAP